MAQQPPQSSQGHLPLFFQRRFLPMWTSFTLGIFTDNTLKQALIIGLTYGLLTLPDGFSILPGVETTPDIVPYAGALFAMAMVLFSPIAGQVADKYPPARMLVITKATELVLMAIAAIGFLLGNGLVLVIMLFLMGVQSAFFSPVRIAAMPKYLAADELVRGNAFFNGGLFVSNSLAYAVGGALIQMANGPVILSAILFVASVIGMGAVFFVPTRPADVPNIKIDFNIFRQYGHMVRFVSAEPPVVRPLFGAAMFYFCAAAVTVTVPYFARDILHGDGQVATIIMICFMIGSLIGAGISASLSKGKSGLNFSALSLGLAILAIFATSGIAALMQAQAPAELYNVQQFLAKPLAWPVLISFTFTAAFIGMYIVPLQAAIQRRVLTTHRARIMAAGNVMNAAAAFVGAMFVLTVTAGWLAPHILFVVLGLLQALVLAYMLYRRRQVPEGLYDEMLTKTDQK